MAEIFPWVATIATIVAASMTAANLGARITGYGFCVFLVGSLAWLFVGFHTGQPALIWTDAVLSVLNIFGVWRWLGVRAKIDDGARSAANASERTPGEALFPISLLGHGAVSASGDSMGKCVDAMAGCRSGRIDYLVVSEGGVAGVGETLRRLPWKDVHVDKGEIVATLKRGEFERLEELQRDQWPGR